MSLSLLVIAGLVAPTVQDPPPKHEVPSGLQARINEAIDGGVEALFARQSLDGSWSNQIDGYGAGMTGLAVYTLLKSEVPRTHPAVVAGIEFIRRHPPTKTYSRSTVILALTAMGDELDEALVESLTEGLLDTQGTRGWAYPAGAPDLSNTQFAALALRAAEASGVNIPAKAWVRLADTALDYVESGEVARSGYAPQGFRYRAESGHATGSMTGAGVAILAICTPHVRGRRSIYVRAIERGSKWLGEHFSVDVNPAPDTESGKHGHLYYYLYGLERVGSLLEIDLLGDKPWYRLGAEKLVEGQSANGTWSGQPQTCFALLFLSRATGKTGPVSGGGVPRKTTSWTFGADDPKEDVSLRGSGRGLVSLWVSSFGDAARSSWGVGDDAVLPVKRVEYIAVDRATPGVERVVAVVDADPERAEKHSRYAARYSFEGPAVFDVFARLTLAYPEGEEHLTSPWMEVRVPFTARPEWAAYATDIDRNELRETSVTVEASSRRAQAQVRPELVVDGYAALGWKPTPEDVAPWLRLDLDRPVRGNVVLLSFAEPKGARFPSYELIVNGEKKSMLTGAFEPDPRRKTLITLERTTRIRSLELRFPVEAAGEWTALGEVEVQRVGR